MTHKKLQKKKSNSKQHKSSELSLEAYQKWLTSKVEKEKAEQERKSREEAQVLEMKRIEKESRRKEAEAKYKEWCEKKRIRDLERMKRNETLYSKFESYHGGDGDNMDAKSNFKAWLTKKLRKERGEYWHDCSNLIIEIEKYLQKRNYKN